MIISLAFASALAFELGPDIVLPIELEHCIVKAELCVEQSPFPEPCDDDASTCTCTEDYETCSWSIPEAHEPACRLDYVWCVLEPPNPDAANFKEWQAHCDSAHKACPTFE